jgi:tRNA/rRNA methyltransferase
MGLDNIRIVMVSPLYGGNVGSVCRAMANMGLSDLAIAAPGRLDMEEARQMCCSASSILESRRNFPSLDAAVADCGLVMGATARPGLYRSHAQSPRELAPRILAAAQSAKVALVFGREDNGLTNDELAVCTQIIKIPSDSVYSSLNVSQAVMVCCYELFIASGQYVPPVEKSEEAPSVVREQMFALWREALLKIGFMKEDKALHMMLGLRRVFSRGKLTRNDIKILMGIARQAMWAASRSVDSGERPDGPVRRRKTATTAARQAAVKPKKSSGEQ